MATTANKSSIANKTLLSFDVLWDAVLVFGSRQGRVDCRFVDDFWGFVCVFLADISSLRRLSKSLLGHFHHQQIHWRHNH